MTLLIRLFNIQRKKGPLLTWGDLVVLVVIFAVMYVGVRLAFDSSAVIQGPKISLSPSVLPWYAALSVGRMAAAYLISIVFALFYGRLAAYNRRTEQVLMPALDVLQSVPILSFLPVVLLSLSVIFPDRVAAELSSIVLIFTSQAWNLAFAWYQSLTTIPKELREASAIFRLNPWLQFRTLELPFAAISLVWNSMMSWAGGWFFLMAAEIFTVGQRDFRLPGLGAYLHEAASQENYQAILWGLATLILTVVLLDQFIWRPLMAWTARFKVEMVVNDNPPTSWVYDLINQSRISQWIQKRVAAPVNERIDRQMGHLLKPAADNGAGKVLPWLWIIIGLAGAGFVLYNLIQAGFMLTQVKGNEWVQVGIGLGATFLRVLAALIIALAWTVPIGVAVGTNPRLAAVLQPVIQVIASVPATAVFPVFVLLLARMAGGLNLAAVILMLMGTQWYLLFNIIAGASAIPQDLRYTARLIHLSRWQRWRSLILPALFPYLVTGMITASGGAWNASIVSEYFAFGGETLKIPGIGSTIAQATADGNYPLLLLATVSMILAVILINRFFWQRLYRLAEERFRME